MECLKLSVGERDPEKESNSTGEFILAGRVFNIQHAATMFCMVFPVALLFCLLLKNVCIEVAGTIL